MRKIEEPGPEGEPAEENPLEAGGATRGASEPSGATEVCLVQRSQCR
jgi:hypothetical protein